MVGKREKEEQLKDKIYKIFLKSRDETSHDRLPVYFQQFCSLIYMWCKDYLKFDIEKTGVEITEVSKRIFEKDNKELYRNKESLIKMLRKSLKNEKAGYYRNYTSQIVKIPKGIKSKIKEVDNVIKMKECYFGRNLTSDERSECVLKWFGNDEHTKKYLDIINAINNSTSLNNSDDDETDNLNSSASSIFKNDISSNPFNDCLNNIYKEKTLGIIKLFIDKKQDRSRDCYRALFTLFCMENEKNAEWLYPVLDRNIISACRNDNDKPTQYEIYMKYHPNAKQNSAEARASEVLNKFIKDLEVFIKNKNQENF